MRPGRGRSVRRTSVVRWGAALAAALLLAAVAVGVAPGGAAAPHRATATGGSSGRTLAPDGPLLRRLAAAVSAVSDPRTRTAIRRSLRDGVTLQRTVRDDLSAVRPEIRRARRLMVDLRPGLQALRDAAPTATRTLRRGTAVTRRLGPELGRLNDTLDATRRLVDDPVWPRTVHRQRHAISLARPLLRELVPAQVDDHAITRTARGLASALSEGNAFGVWARTLVLLDPQRRTRGAGG